MRSTHTHTHIYIYMYIYMYIYAHIVVVVVVVARTEIVLRCRRKSVCTKEKTDTRSGPMRTAIKVHDRTCACVVRACVNLIGFHV